MSDYPRDLTGYAGAPPVACWPNEARIAVQFVLNIEEGGEMCVLHGDAASEAFLSEGIGAQPLEGGRHLSRGSISVCGPRARAWPRRALCPRPARASPVRGFPEGFILGHCGHRRTRARTPAG